LIFDVGKEMVNGETLRPLVYTLRRKEKLASRECRAVFSAVESGKIPYAHTHIRSDAVDTRTCRKY
jgi:hypothetical protein